MFIHLNPPALDSITPSPDWEERLQAYLSKPPFWLDFPEPIETRFKIRGRGGRLTRFVFSLRWALGVFALLAVCDWLLLTDGRELAFALRMTTLVICGVVGLVIMPREVFAPYREGMIAILFGLLATTHVVISFVGGGQASILYDGALFLALLLCNQLARVRYRQALPFSVFWLGLFVIHEFARHDTDGLVRLFACVFAALLALISLSAKRAMELDNRATFALKTLNSIAANKLAEANRELQALARFDPLTGLPNRRYFDEYLERMQRNAFRTKEPISVLFIDVDYFKRYNDHYGHSAGDDCLCFVASVVRFAARRPLDLAARIGGEEFIILLPDTTPSDAARVAEELRCGIEHLAVPHEASPLGAHVTVSIGVAGGIPEAETTPESMVSAADVALYKAKDSGRNRVAQAAA